MVFGWWEGVGVYGFHISHLTIDLCPQYNHLVVDYTRWSGDMPGFFFFSILQALYFSTPGVSVLGRGLIIA
jgi:hypothetical protein